ncbi:MAG TPA: arylsulfotransferase family protein [Pirellulales bacterium]|nr:arylsulfotransferase family protein [Pirellulales bacterium]
MRVARGANLLSACVSVAGVALLGYLLGAAAMFFQLPPSAWLANAFAGARVWSEPEHKPLTPLIADKGARSGTPVDRPERTCDGFTLYTCSSSEHLSTQASLINMRRDVVHQWAISFSRIWPNPEHLDFRPNDLGVGFFDCYLYPNGDLLAVLHVMNRSGCGLAKLDKDSNLLWAYPANMHHAVDVGEDGTIYALRQEIADELPPGLEGIDTPCSIDYLVAFSPDGEPLSKPISILSALKNSPYAALLSTLHRPPRRPPQRPGSTAPHVEYAFQQERDPLHTNCVRVLRSDMAAKFPNFKAGHILVSVRTLSIIAMLDPDSGAVEWAARGAWQAQHDPQFLENGHLLIFDNLGSPLGSRVLEYDPQTQAFPWSYSGEGRLAFYTSERGMCQRLPNGNTFIVSSEDGEMLEVTADKEVVWSCALDGFIMCGRRYAPEQLPFLAGDERPRP